MISFETITHFRERLQTLKDYKRGQIIKFKNFDHKCFIQEPQFHKSLH